MTNEKYASRVGARDEVARLILTSMGGLATMSSTPQPQLVNVPLASSQLSERTGNGTGTISTHGHPASTPRNRRVGARC